MRDLHKIKPARISGPADEWPLERAAQTAYGVSLAPTQQDAFMFPNDRPQTLGEEIANTISHGVGAVSYTHLTLPTTPYV